MRNAERDLEQLDDRLRQAPTLSPHLFGDVAAQCPRLGSLRHAGKTAALDRMIEAGAFTDAVIALVALELPNWSIRRIICEEGRWHCALSRHPALPLFLDECAEGSHSTLALAILRAFVAARRSGIAAPQRNTSVPQVRPAPAFVYCCDNFA